MFLFSCISSSTPFLLNILLFLSSFFSFFFNFYDLLSCFSFLSFSLIFFVFFVFLFVWGYIVILDTDITRRMNNVRFAHNKQDEAKCVMFALDVQCFVSVFFKWYNISLLLMNTVMLYHQLFGIGLQYW